MQMQRTIACAAVAILAAITLAGCGNQPEGTPDGTAGAKARAEIAQRMGTQSGPNTRPGGMMAPGGMQPGGMPPGAPGGVPMSPPR